jgi:hypothetical protein
MPSIVYEFAQFPYTFPFTFGDVDKAIQVEDYDSVHFLQPALDAHAAISNMPSLFFQPDPGTLFESVWLPGIGQQEPNSLMPTYDVRFLYGDIANMPYFSMQLFDNIHFGPDGVDTFAGPIAVDILEESADVEIRTPE